MSVMPGLPELCLLAALYLGASSEKLTARVWQPSRPDFQLPESFEGSLNLESKLNFGIALAGGGMRGGALGHGVLRTLREAKLLEKARYLSVTSGTVWLGLPLYYQAIDTVEEYLGQMLRPEDMTPEALIQKTGSGLRRLRHFRNYPKGHKGPPGAEQQLLQTELLEENETSLESMFGCPVDEGWCACMVERFQPGSFHDLYSILTAYAFLHPFELAGWGSTHCHESQLNRVRAKFGSGKTIYTSKDVSRKLPFLLSQSAILEPYTGLTPKDPLIFFPLEQTPLYAGTIPGYNASDVHRSIGDVLVEPFAWGSRARSPWTNFSNGNELRMDVSRSFLNVGDLATWAGTATSYIADFQIRTWADKIPKCLVAEGEKLLPHANFWSPLALDSEGVPLAHEEAVGDAGVYDDIGHIPLLRRKVKKIAIFTSGAIHDDLCEMTYVLAAFGQPGCLQPPNPPGASNPKMKAGSLTVFDSEAFPDFWKQIKDAQRVNETAFVRGRYTVVDNEVLGIKGGWKVDILWVVVLPSKSFRASLPSQTADLLPNWFPSEFAADMTTRFEMSAASQYASWFTQRFAIPMLQQMLSDGDSAELIV